MSIATMHILCCYWELSLYEEEILYEQEVNEVSNFDILVTVSLNQLVLIGVHIVRI